MALDHAALMAAVKGWVLQAGVRGPSVDDVTQEVCIKVIEWVGAGKVQPGKEFAFARRVAFSKATDHHRGERRRREDPWPEDPYDGDDEPRGRPANAVQPTESVEDEGRRKEHEEDVLYEAMAGLNDRYRELLHQVFMKNRSYQELAEDEVRRRIQTGQLPADCDQEEEERLAYERISMTTRRARKALAKLIRDGGQP